MTKKQAPTPEEVLACEMADNDADDARDVREYLLRLLEAVWVEEENFSGKRPFGNSSWQYEVYGALLDSMLIDGEFDDDGSIKQCDTGTADRAIIAAIRSLH